MLPLPTFLFPKEKQSVNAEFMNIHSSPHPWLYPQNSLMEILMELFFKSCFNEVCLIFQLLFSVLKPPARWND